jgi:hypothetical protein
MTKMDVSSGALPENAMFGPEGRQIDLMALADDTMAALVPALIQSKIIKSDAKPLSYGFAMATLGPVNIRKYWDNFDKLVLFALGWGPDSQRCIADAVRMMRYSARTTRDSYCAQREFGSVLNNVKSVEEDGSFTWGDIPLGGAAFVNFNTRQLLGSTSGFSPEENHAITTSVLSFLAVKMDGASGKNAATKALGGAALRS